ncbi:stage II sporulation protein M [Pullulanibacillus sp. KACC 23026]|uniref:stage II sporulation protein M n=1 Tax=Pullulanibacillus sp. KACC 23026 TaxID=3028315 RepID=UPI0023AF093C|nr:stage II sporulation protein M [Pullulanibacillus sp. KACC 23026]WEG11453.1 stage II sporulation protein M [Pullulanibacillus sp. KACC 23026]
MSKTLKSRILSHLQENISLYIFSIALFLTGIIFGAIIVNSLPASAKTNLLTYLNTFFNEMGKGNLVDPSSLFNESFTHGFQYLGFIWLLGLSIIGLPLIFVLLFLKGIVVGFTVGFLVNQMGWHGFWMALASVFPQNLVLVPAFIIVSTAAVSFSLKMIRQLLMKNRKTPLFPQFGRYGLLMVGMIGVIVVSSLFEAYISPVLMKGIIQ